VGARRRTGGRLRTCTLGDAPQVADDDPGDAAIVLEASLDAHHIAGGEPGPARGQNPGDEAACRSMCFPSRVTTTTSDSPSPDTGGRATHPISHTRLTLPVLTSARAPVSPGPRG